MYDPLETDISRKQLNRLIELSKENNVAVALIGGWATYFHVNNTYKRAFGIEYMGSRDIDLFVKATDGAKFTKLISDFGFEPYGMKFRYEKIYDRERNQFVPSKDINNIEIFNLIYIFLDLFSNKHIDGLGTWHDLKALEHFDTNKDIAYFENIPVVEIDTLIDLKCTAIFARDKADKENKDACDLYALLNYGGQKYAMTSLLKKAIEKILSRNDLLHAVSEHVLRDATKQSIVLATLQKLKQ